jgi:hypothetical protein
LLDRMTDDELESFLVGLRALRRVRTELVEAAAERAAGAGDPAAKGRR